MQKASMKIITFYCAILMIMILHCFVAFPQVDVLTQHNDLARTGWNNKETSLNTNNVNSNTFGFLYSRAVDDQIFAQPLVVSGVNIPSVGTRNVLYVCTVNNTIYAFDADNGNIPPYWQINYTPSGYRPPNSTDMHPGLCGGSYYDFSSNIGIIGTPVINKASNTLYFVTKIVSTVPGVEDNHAWDGSITNEEYTYSSAGFYQYLHAVDLSTGAEKFNGPVNITASVTAPGDGNISGVITFDPRRQFNRGGLVLSNGIVYVPFAAHCDWDPYHGWLIGYSKSLQQRLAYMTTPNDGRGGIWMSGAAPAVDSSGNLFFVTGNGFDDGTHYNDSPGVLENRGESVIKLTPNAPDSTASALNISSYFTPFNYQQYNDADLDFPIQVLLIPNTNMLLTGCKDNNIYLLDRTNLGGFNSTTNNVLQETDVGGNAQMHSSFAYFAGPVNQYVYQFAENSLLQSFKVGTNSLGTVVTGSVSGPTGSSGAYMSVSSNGSDTNSAILWIAHAVNGCNANQQVCPGIVRAVKANDVTTELWNSGINAADNLGNFAKMSCPTVANGKVYVNTFSNKLVVYGQISDTSCNKYPNIATTANNASATYSASSNSGSAGNAFDGNASTSWVAASSGTGGGDNAYITVNLGAQYNICKVVLLWGSDYGTGFNIQGSNDGTNFTTISTITGNAALNDTISLANFSYQYIRMQGVTRSASTNGYIINELEVFGQLVNPCSTPTNLSASGITQNTGILNWQAVSGATSYNFQYKTSIVSSWVTGSSSSNTLNISALSCGTGYTYEVQAVCATGSSAQAAGTLTTSACSGTCGPLPTRYFNADIGAIGVAGSSCLNNGIYTLQGSGNDIGGNADQFQYAFTNLNGDEYVTAQVLTQDAVNPANKAGLMFRDSLSDTSPFAYIATTSGNGIVFEYRSTSGGATTVVTVSGLAAPYWLKLNKSGTQYGAYISATGALNSWVQVGTTVDLGFGNSTAYVGMAVTSANNSVLSTATIGSYSETAVILPIGLISFTGNDINNQFVILKWATSAEVNSKYFEIQRSVDGIRFQNVIQVDAKGNSNSDQDYSAIDYHPDNGINLYRLQEVDNDGTVSYSPIVKINFGSLSGPQIFPNPANSYFTISAGQEAMKEISVIDVSGKVIDHIINNGSSIINIYSGSLASGIYIVQIKTSSTVYQQKLVKQ